MNQEFYNAVKESVQMSQQRWVEWRHEMTGLLHCGSCLSLHKCWFVFEKAPVSPLHEKCHCTTVAIPASQVKSNAVAKATTASIIHTCLIPRISTNTERTRLLRVGDILFRIRNGCKKKSKNKEGNSIFWEITNWVH